MRTEKVGRGEPEIAVVGSIHGDEPCGKKAIEKFLREDYEIKRPVKFLIANEKALGENQRFLDSDLNRSFPGNPDSESHEERLAAKILPELKGLKVLDIHSTHSEPVPFYTFSHLTEETLEVMRSAGVDRGCQYADDHGDMNFHAESVIVEVGKQGTEEAVDMAYDILLNFLAAQGVIDREFEKSDPELFEYYEEVNGGDWEFTARNFELVEKGETFARKGTTELVTTEDFYPVLMSTNGYEHMLGHKARKLEVPERLK